MHTVFRKKDSRQFLCITSTNLDIVSGHLAAKEDHPHVIAATLRPPAEWRRPVKDKGKGRYSCSWEPHLTATGRHLPYGFTQCYLPSDTSECTPPNPSHAGWYSIYLPRRDGRLS